jgi:uncharacterized membrane protein YebE (DUF533 family)
VYLTFKLGKMKTSNKVYIALAAGVAVAGLVGFLLTTDKGKKLTKKWKEKGLNSVNDLAGTVNGLKQKFGTCKTEMANAAPKVNLKEEVPG